MKINLLVAALLASVISGCASNSATSAKPEIFAGKGAYFAQDKTKSFASNLTAFAGYPGKISDHEMPAGLRNGLDFTSGAYLGFSAFDSLWGATGLGAFAMLSGDNIRPLTISSVIVMVPLSSEQRYNDLSVAKLAMEQSLEKLDDEYFKTYYANKKDTDWIHKLKTFSSDKSMNGIICQQASMASRMLSDLDAECNIDGYKVDVVFARPATGTEFPELKLLPKGKYAVVLLNKNGNFQVRKDALWAARLDSINKTYKINNYTLPFISPGKDGKRIMFFGEEKQTKILYK